MSLMMMCSRAYTGCNNFRTMNCSRMIY